MGPKQGCRHLGGFREGKGGKLEGACYRITPVYVPYVNILQLKVFQYGERVVDRIDFEELALKGVDPSIGPTVLHPDFSGKVGRKESSLVKVQVRRLFVS